MSTPSHYRFGPFLLDPGERRLLRNGEPVELKPKEFDLLVALVERAGHLATKDELMEALWPGVVVEENALSVHVSKLRAALGETARDWRYVETVPRAGYRFAPVEAEAAPAGGVRLGPDADGAGEDDTGEGGVAPARPPGRRAGSAWKAAAIGALAVALGLAAWAWGSGHEASGGTPQSVAVLPFRALAPDSSLDALGLGLADALITQLGRTGGLAVRPTSAVVPFASIETGTLEAARALGVDAIVEGRLQRDGDRLRVTVQLLDRDGGTRWAEALTTRADDLLGVQDAVAREVTATLVPALEPGTESRQPTQSPEAHRAYLAGRYHWSRRTDDGLRRAVASYRAALEADPLYAQAWAALGEAYALAPWYAAEPPREAFPRAEAAARRALELDDGLAEAHAVLAQVAWQYDRDADEAGDRFRRALALHPRSATLQQRHGEFLAYTGRPDDGRDALRRAQALDPLSLVIATDIGSTYFFEGRPEEAERTYRGVLDLEPGFGLARVFLAMTLTETGRADEAVEVLEAVAGVGEGPLLWQAQLGRAYAKADRRADAEAVLAYLRDEAGRRFVSPYGLALVQDGLGDAEAALDRLAEAATVGDPYLVYFAQDPQLDGLRGHTRFGALADAVALP